MMETIALFFIAAALFFIALGLNNISKALDKPHPMFDKYTNEEIADDAELESVLEVGIYHPTPEDLASYYNDRSIEDRVADYDPYEDKELQELING